MLDFPASPTTGQTFTAAGCVWQYDGAKWIPASTGGSSFVLEAPADGQSYERQSGLWVPSVGFAQGFVNKFRNANFDVWQRGTTFSSPVTGSYTADGWIIGWTGAAPSSVQLGSGPGIAGVIPNSYSALQITGAAGTTVLNVAQRIESLIATPLSNVPVTVQFLIANNTAASVTPQLQVSHPTSGADNWGGGGTIDVGPVNLQPCPAGAWTRVAYTFTVPSTSAGSGLQVNLQFGAQVTTASVRVCQADIRATPGVATGLNNNPPPPELRPVAIETPLCQRYYEAGQGIWSGNTTSGQNYYTIVSFRQTKRGTLNVTANYVNASAFPATAPTVGAQTPTQFQTTGLSNASGTGFYQFTWIANAEL